MAILDIQTHQTGEAGVLPSYATILTSDTEAAVLTAGYLNAAVQNGASFALPCIAKISTKSSSTAAYQVGWYQITHVGADWSVVPAGNPGDIVLPTVANQLVHATGTTGTLSTDAADVVNLGNITAGASGTAGVLSSFPGTAAKGSLKVTAVANTGDTVVTISNAAHGQASVISIPDGGQATAEFVISDSAGTQNITSGGLQVDAGIVSSGLAAGGFVGEFDAYPTTTASGVLSLKAAVNATGDFDTTISNGVAIGQSQVISIPDVGAATGSFLVSGLASADVSGNIVTFDITVGQAALATAGTVTLQASSGAKQYKIRELYVNSGGTNFSGGGGDRLATISDGTTDYSVIPAASMQTLANTGWGETGLPFPASAAINTSSVAGAAITIAYSGGATDYTAGSVVISGVLERVA